MGAAFLGIDVVDEAVDVLLIAVIVLKGYLHHDIILGAVEVNRLRVEDLLLLVQVLHKGADAAIKMEALNACRRALLQDDIRMGDEVEVVF